MNITDVSTITYQPQSHQLPTTSTTYAKIQSRTAATPLPAKAAKRSSLCHGTPMVRKVDDGIASVEHLLRCSRSRGFRLRVFVFNNPSLFKGTSILRRSRVKAAVLLLMISKVTHGSVGFLGP